MAGVEGIVLGTGVLGSAVAFAGGSLLLTALVAAILLALPERRPMPGDSYGWEQPLLEAQEPGQVEAVKLAKAA